MLAPRNVQHAHGCSANGFYVHLLAAGNVPVVSRTKSFRPAAAADLRLVLLMPHFSLRLSPETGNGTGDVFQEDR